MRLVHDQVLEIGQHSATLRGVGEQEGMVDDHQVGPLRLGAGAVDVAVLGRAEDADAVHRVRGDARPEDLLPALQAKLGSIPAVGLVQPGEHLELEAELLRVVAGLGEVAAPTPEREVVGAALEQHRLELPGQPLLEEGQVLGQELLLQGVGRGGDDHLLALGQGSAEGRDQVGDALAGPGAGLDHQPASPLQDLGDGEQHLELGLAVLVLREGSRQRSFRQEQAGHPLRVPFDRIPRDGEALPAAVAEARLGGLRGRERFGEEA